MSPLTTSVVNPLKSPALTAGLLLMLLGACQPTPQTRAEFHSYSGQAQGTTFSILIADTIDHDFSAEIDSVLQVMDRSLSTYVAESNISRFNRGETKKGDNHLLYMVERSQEIHALTNGAFDITVGPLVKAWGFGPDGELNRQPDPDTILPYIGMEKIEIKGDSIIAAHPKVQLDLNAIAQGYSVDQVAALLERYGVKNYMVEIGGEVKTKGGNRSGKAWRIGIDKPVPSEQRVLSFVVELENKGLATSGNYRKFRTVEGRKVSHTIDPATGYPALHSLLSATVIAKDAATADALATAFMVAGIDRSKNMLSTAEFRKMEVEALLIFSQGDSLSHFASPGFPELSTITNK